MKLELGVGFVFGALLYAVTTVVLFIDTMFGIFDLYYYVGVEVISALGFAVDVGMMAGIAAIITGNALVKRVGEIPANEMVEMS